MNYPNQSENPARIALTRAVNRAMANGSPVYVNQPVEVSKPARERIYLGISGSRTREVFRYKGTPTQESHGDRYTAVIGPFRTVRAARFMAECGQGNPHLQTVSDAERLAR